MSRYDILNPRKELEQIISDELEKALKKRGFQIKHNGTSGSHAPAGLPDIEMWDDLHHIIVEVTKRKKSSAEGEFLAIKDHLEGIKQTYPRRKCFCIYISPETHYRMINAMRDFNILNSNKNDLKMMPFCFSTFEIFINKLITSPKDLYKKDDIIRLFQQYKDFITDERILKVISENLFQQDGELSTGIEIKEENAHQKTIQSLIKDLKKLEDDLRKNGIATHDDAIKNVIYLVFMKLYEEKREYEGLKNRFSKIGFVNYQDMEGNKKTAVHELFNKIKDDKELKTTKILTEFDRLAEKLHDKFVIDYFINPFEKYFFYKTKVDGLGAAYEVLGQLSGKDVKAGQFFTPENIVRAMVKIAELSTEDIVLDPACGTGRFLIYAMYDMLEKVAGININQKKEAIKKQQLYGADFDVYVAKLAKMNMYIHRDGKTNIKDKDGLLLSEFDNKISVFITNPPLGNLSYWLHDYDDTFRENRMELIPKKDGKVTGNEMKGAALFLNASKHYLKNVRNSDEFPEWKGGKLLIILDESILNVDDYKPIRNFVKNNFYIKAVISLTEDTFVPVSNTKNKTSILYAIKKDDTDAVQTEPIFFAYVDKVGLNTKRKVCDNHLFNEKQQDLITAYLEFKSKLLTCYDGNILDAEKQKRQIKTGKRITILDNSYYFIRSFYELQNEDRLDVRFFDPKYDKIKRYMKSSHAKALKHFVIENGVEYGLTAGGLEAGKIPFINIENLTEEGYVNSDNIKYVNETPNSKLLKETELLISRSRLVGLASIITQKEVGFTYGSYMIRFKLNNDVIPLFVAKCINSEKGKLQTELLKTGATGENINSGQLLQVVIPDISKNNQKEYLEKVADIENEARQLFKKANMRMKKSQEIISDLFNV
jgi:type I restriction-modification system DNA methylase subunit